MNDEESQRFCIDLILDFRYLSHFCVDSLFAQDVWTWSKIENKITFVNILQKANRGIHTVFFSTYIEFSSVLSASQEFLGMYPRTHCISGHFKQ